MNCKFCVKYWYACASQAVRRIFSGKADTSANRACAGCRAVIQWMRGWWGGGGRRSDASPGWSLTHLEQALRQPGIAPRDAIVPDGYLERVRLPHQDTEASGARDRGVEQIALEQHAMLGDERDDHDGIFAALAFVDGDGVGQNQFV